MGPRFESVKAHHGPLVKWLRQRPLTPLTSVRIRYGSPVQNSLLSTHPADGVMRCRTSLFFAFRVANASLVCSTRETRERLASCGSFASARMQKLIPSAAFPYPSRNADAGFSMEINEGFEKSLDKKDARQYNRVVFKQCLMT